MVTPSPCSSLSVTLPIPQICRTNRERERGGGVVKDISTCRERGVGGGVVKDISTQRERWGDSEGYQHMVGW